MLFYLNRDSTLQTNCDLALDWCEIILIIIVATIDIILIYYFHARYLFVRLSLPTLVSIDYRPRFNLLFDDTLDLMTVQRLVA